MKTILHTFTLLILILSYLNTSAQTHKLSGKVTDAEGEILTGVNVLLVKNDSIITGTITDINGEYSIDVTYSNIIRFTFVGYNTIEKELTPALDKLDVSMVVTETNIDEVVLMNIVSEDVAGMEVGRSKAEKGKTASPSIHLKYEKEDKSSLVSDEKRLRVESEKTETNNNINSGTLTAGEVNDFSKWKLWNDFTLPDLKTYQTDWTMFPYKRFAFQLTDNDGFPVIDKQIRLLKNNEKIWTARTDNTGKAELWWQFFEIDSSKNEEVFTIEIQDDKQTYTLKNAKLFENGMNHFKLQTENTFPNMADIAFVVDATGSMADEIEYLKIELNDVITRVKKQHKDVSINLGSIFYRDVTDEYVTRSSILSTDISQTIQFITQQRADGGGDFPEALDSAMNEAINSFAWSKTARTRIIFLVMDAPPHPEAVKRMLKIAENAAEKGIKIVPLSGSGIDKNTEYLMRCLALASNGTYTFLTDDSGIGGSHIKPSTDKWEVELLNNMFVRIINQYLYVPKMPKKRKEKILNDSTISIFSETPIITQNNGFPVDTAGNKPDVSPKDFEFDLKFYPNPTTGILNIKTNKKLKEIYLADLSGKILEKYIPDDNDLLTIDISIFPTGIYFLKYPFTGKWKAGKVVLMH